MNQNVYNQEYLDKELELKRKGMIYVTAGMGISALTAVINNCLVSALYRNIYIYIYIETGDDLRLGIIGVLRVLYMGVVWNAAGSEISSLQCCGLYGQHRLPYMRIERIDLQAKLHQYCDHFSLYYYLL